MGFTQRGDLFGFKDAATLPNVKLQNLRSLLVEKFCELELCDKAFAGCDWDAGVGRDAGKLIKELAPLVDGRGGGKADFAQAGGKDPGGIDRLLEKANELIG